MENRSKKIGIFDSGIGGLTILKPLLQFFPAQYVYLADTAHLPYGDKPASEIIRYAIQIASFFEQQGIDTCIIACHTASAIAQPTLEKRFPSMQFIGVLEEVCKAAAEQTKNGTIGIIATTNTIAHHGHKKFLAQIKSSITIIEQACPELVPAIEASPFDQRRIKSLLYQYLEPLLQKKIDTLILGCTHYSLIKKQMRKILGSQINLIGAEEFVAQQVKELVGMQMPEQFTVECVTTSEPLFFDAKAQQLTELSLPPARLIQLSDSTFSSWEASPTEDEKSF